MQSMRLTRVLLAVCLTAAALSACGGNDDSASAPSNPANPSNPSQPAEKRCAP
jgi:ABC-type oligopeptide transport system substrate-binding subunit